MTRCHRCAVSRLHLPDGQVLPNRVLEFEDACIVRHYALTEELANTVWRRIDYYWLSFS